MFVCDGAWVRHRRTTRPGPTLPAAVGVPGRVRHRRPTGLGPALFGAWEILGYGFQDMVFKTWDLNFGAWIFTLVVSKIET